MIYPASAGSLKKMTSKRGLPAERFDFFYMFKGF